MLHLLNLRTRSAPVDRDTSYLTDRYHGASGLPPNGYAFHPRGNDRAWSPARPSH